MCIRDRQHILLILILLSLFIFISAFSYVKAVSSDIANSVFRLHVIANSDTQEDQTLKYQVRDAIISYINSEASSASSKEEVIQIAKDRSEEITQIAKSVIQEKGFDYDVNVKIGNFYFPTKTYGDISFPAGDYDALRVEIGKASGQNWWCVMFPPLCFVDVSTGIVPDDSKELMKDQLSDEEYDLLSDNSSDIKFKFKLIELFHQDPIETAKK